MTERAQTQIPGDVLENLFGTIEKTRVIGYFRYVFTIHVRTSKNFDMVIKVGKEGDQYSIYRYSPDDDWESQWGSGLTIVSISPAENGVEISEKIDLEAIESALKPLKVKFEPDVDLNNYWPDFEHKTIFGNDETFGKMIDVEITWYHKYCFVFCIKTDKGFEIEMATKDDAADISDVLNLTWFSLRDIAREFSSIKHADKSKIELDNLLQELEDRFIARDEEEDA